MPTSNPVITPAWIKIADASNTELLASWQPAVQVEFATTSADAEPTVSGHRLDQGSCITRSLMGSGYVWARVAKGQSPSSIKLAVTK